MGQQQLLFIMLSVIVVGISVAVGISLFTANSAEQKRNEVINECILLASDAQIYYRKPIAYGGGGKTFTGWKVPNQFHNTAVGSFRAVIISPQEVIITGTGNEIVTGSDSVKVEVSVTPNSYQTTIIN